MTRSSTGLGAQVRAALATLADLAAPRPCAGCGHPSGLPPRAGRPDVTVLRAGVTPPSALPPLVLPARPTARADLAGVSLRGGVCAGCAAALAGPPILAAPGSPATPGRRGPPSACGDEPSAWDRPWDDGPLCVAAARYAGPAGRMVVAFKERARLDLTRVLAGALARAVAVAVPLSLPDARRRPQVVLLVPVPTGRAAVRRRGFDHSARLAARAALLLRRAGQPAWAAAGLLRQARRTADQVGLGARERATNLAGAFTAHPRLAARVAAGVAEPGGLTVVVVDDVVTTGATIREAARALAAVRIAVPAAAAVATARSPRPVTAAPAGGRCPTACSAGTERWTQVGLSAVGGWPSSA